MCELENISEHIGHTEVQWLDTGVEPFCEAKPYMIPIKGCRIFDNEKLIHDYKPCKNPNGVDGMYCLVSDEFLDADSFAKMLRDLKFL